MRTTLYGALLCCTLGAAMASAQDKPAKAATPAKPATPAKAPAPAAAPVSSLELSVAVVSTQTQPIKIGDLIWLQVSLKNKSVAVAKGVTKLMFDDQSVALKLDLGKGRSFRDTRIHKAPTNRIKIATEDFAPGETKTLLIELPAIRSGELKVTASYGAGRLESKPLAIKIAEKDGKKEVLVEIYTNKGLVKLKLMPDVALGSCMNFLRLAKKGFYNGLTFHRIIAGFMVQGGDPEGTGQGGPGYSVPLEKSKIPHAPGMLAMARSGHPDSAGSQFYICVGSPSWLNEKYTIFGKVTAGLDVVEALGKVKTGGAAKPIETQTIRKIIVRP